MSRRESVLRLAAITSAALLVLMVGCAFCMLASDIVSEIQNLPGV